MWQGPPGSLQRSIGITASDVIALSKHKQQERPRASQSHLCRPSKYGHPEALKRPIGVAALHVIGEGGNNQQGSASSPLQTQQAGPPPVLHQHQLTHQRRSLL